MINTKATQEIMGEDYVNVVDNSGFYCPTCGKINNREQSCDHYPSTTNDNYILPIIRQSSKIYLI